MSYYCQQIPIRPKPLGNPREQRALVFEGEVDKGVEAHDRIERGGITFPQDHVCTDEGGPRDERSGPRDLDFGEIDSHDTEARFGQEPCGGYSRPASQIENPRSRLEQHAKLVDPSPIVS
jgi:hypothetical protein